MGAGTGVARIRDRRLTAQRFEHVDPLTAAWLLARRTVPYTEAG
jgi:hypothetical protein